MRAAIAVNMEFRTRRKISPNERSPQQIKTWPVKAEYISCVSDKHKAEAPLFLINIPKSRHQITASA